MNNQLNNQVTQFLDELSHPLRNEIERLRHIILGANLSMTENIKWNGPNYCFEQDDRVTMRIQPPKQIQLIFHRGAKVKTQPKDKLINDPNGLLVWKANDRAVATFRNMSEIENSQIALVQIVQYWIEAAKE